MCCSTRHARVRSTPWLQQTRVYPYPLGTGSARPNPKVGALDPENPLFLGLSALRGLPRPWSETMVSEGARPWGRARSGDCDGWAWHFASSNHNSLWYRIHELGGMKHTHSENRLSTLAGKQGTAKPDLKQPVVQCNDPLRRRSPNTASYSGMQLAKSAPNSGKVDFGTGAGRKALF